jgi:hypothetical protein
MCAVSADLSRFHARCRAAIYPALTKAAAWACKFFQMLAKLFQIFRLFLQTFPKIPLAVLRDFKGLRGAQARFSNLQIFFAASRAEIARKNPFQRREAMPVRSDKPDSHSSKYSDCWQ